jgi:hypothetical protein
MKAQKNIEARKLAGEIIVADKGSKVLEKKYPCVGWVVN